MITITKLTAKGDERLELSEEEAEQLCSLEQGRYFIVDAETQKVLNEIRLVEGQELMLIPRVAGG